MMDMNNEYQEALHYPDNGFGNQAAELEKGMSQLYVQVQDGEHKIIWPNEIANRSCVLRRGGESVGEPQAGDAANEASMVHSWSSSLR